MKKKLKIIIDNLNKGLIEREEHSKLAILALLANENLVFIGPPGTAKSEISRRLSNVLEEGSYFEYLLTKFTTPEELFGPISIKELEEDKFKRQTKGYITDSNIVFLDEVFKANSSILNALLTILNERIYHNGAIREDTKIMSIIAASNELPVGESELEALYDRFLLKKEVTYIDNPMDLFNISGKYSPIIERININYIEKIQDNSSNVMIPDYIANKILQIKKQIEETFGPEELISDRRLVKTIRLLKIAAYTSDRDQVSIFDLLLLKDIFWRNPKNLDKIREIIIKEILDVSAFEKSNLYGIYENWRKHFDKLYTQQKTDDKGNLLYVPEDGIATTEKRGEIHLRDNMGNYIFYKGHRDHVKVLAELGRFDHGYIDSGIKTIDKKIVWKYEFSPIKIKTSHDKSLDDFDKLTITGSLPPYMTNSYLEYREYYKKNKEDLKPLLGDIKRNVETEMELVKEIYNNFRVRQEYLEKERIEALWVSKKDLVSIKELIDMKVEENNELLKAYEKLISEIDMAME